MEPIGHVALAERRELATYPAPRGVDAVPHGFRSSFRDWAAERTRVPREICEHALAHVVGEKRELDYRRTDFREKRRDLMHRLARYLSPPPATVVAL